MAITKNFINTIREEIASIIPVGPAEVFKVASAFPISTISGFPAVIVMISENEVAYASTGSVDARKMTLNFSLNVYYPAQVEADQQQTEEAMGEAVSELLRVFCVPKPLASADLARVTITPWGETTVGDATFRTAQVILSVSTWVDTQ